MRKGNAVKWLLISVSRQESLMMRGLAILAIISHNFLHLIVGRFVPENEMFFRPSSAREFWRHVLANPMDSAWEFVSHFGWYGVPVFIFLSGYGLHRGHVAGTPGPRKSFLMVLAKMLWLAAPAYLLNFGVCYLLGLDGPSLNALMWWRNVIYPFNFPSIGPFWYFGLALQLYLLYFIWIRTEDYNVGYGAILLSVLMTFLCGPGLIEEGGCPELLQYLRANSLGWLGVFCWGVLAAKYGCVSGMKWSWWGGLLISFVVLTASPLNYALWAFSPIPAVLAVYVASKICGLVMVLREALAWVGRYSAGIFVIHPICRMVFLPYAKDGRWGLAVAFFVYLFSVVCLSFSYVCALDLLSSRFVPFLRNIGPVGKSRL